MIRSSILFVAFALPAVAWAAEWTLLPASSQPRQMMSRYLKRQAQQAFARRQAEFESLATPEEIRQYQDRRRKFFIRQLGGWPQRTPLNPRIVGTVQGAGYRIEKVIFESRPRFYVTANLYLPTGDASPSPCPAVLVPCGHTPEGKFGYQQPCILLARNGMAAFCYDPIGQGERYQVLDDQGKRKHGSTTEHSLVGVGSILVGRNTASYRVWDGIRALDYLQSRKDIDGKRLGCTGNSGGGTLTEYLMALDDRIQCAAPGCCVTSFARRLETIGPGDAEQNVFGQIGFGLDHADYTHLRAPKPTLLLTATRDFVDIQGSWDIFRETKRLYTRMGYAERVDLVEADAKHGFSQPLREGMVRWMSRWLLGQDRVIVEGEMKLHTLAELRCTPDGQVQRIDGAKSVMDLNAAVAKHLEPQRRKLWDANDRGPALAAVRERAGIRPLSELPKPKVRSLEQVPREGFTVEKLVLEPETGIELPALLIRPKQQATRRCLYLHGTSKSADLAADGNLEQLAAAGVLVLAVDLRGSGETGPAKLGQWGGQWDDIVLAYLLGRSMLGMRTEDALIAARYLAETDEAPAGTQVELFAEGLNGPVALHAAALEPALFAKVHLAGAPPSWSNVVAQPEAPGMLVNAVHGALEAYDLPDLVQSIGGTRIKIGRP